MIPGIARSTTWRGLALTATTGLVLAMPLPAPWHSAWRAKLLDLGHIPLFFALTWALRRFATGRWSWACGIAIGVAALGEIAQATLRFLGRSGDFDDFIRGAIGSILAATIAFACSRPQSVAKYAVSMGFGAALVAWPVLDAAPILVDAWHAHRQFPVLVDFSNRFEMQRIAARGTLLKPGHIAFDVAGDEPYPGFDFLPPCNDWRGYRNLVVEFDVPMQLELTLTVKDFRKANGYAERFNRDAMKFYPGPQRLTIPLADIERGPSTRPLDLAQVQVVQMFADRKSLPKFANGVGPSLDLRRIRLE